MKEATDAHCEFLADADTTEEEKDTADKEFDGLDLIAMRLWDKGHEKLEHMSADFVDFHSESAKNIHDTDSSERETMNPSKAEIAPIITDVSADEKESKDIEVNLPEAETFADITSFIDIPDSLEESVADKMFEPEKLPNMSIPKFLKRNCDLCDFENGSKSSLKVHTNTVHEEGILSCHDCEKKNAYNDKFSG